MPKPEWGTKRVCPNCASRFYDLMRDPMTCPICGTSYEASAFAIGRKGAAKPVAAKPEIAAAQTSDDDAVIEDGSDDAGADVELDDDILEDDDDESTEVPLEELAEVDGDDEDDS